MTLCRQRLFRPIHADEQTLIEEKIWKICL